MGEKNAEIWLLFGLQQWLKSPTLTRLRPATGLIFGHEYFYITAGRQLITRQRLYAHYGKRTHQAGLIDDG